MPRRPLRVTRRPESFASDDRRVVPTYMDFHDSARVRSIFSRLMQIPEKQVPGLLKAVMQGYAGRHRDLVEAFRVSYRRVREDLETEPEMSETRRLLVSAYFTKEYSIESAALFNPSMVPHPDQSDLPRGEVRFLLSLRATGEGHLSSIVFRRGVVRQDGAPAMEPAPRFAHTARPHPDRDFDKALFRRKLRESDEPDAVVDRVLDLLPGRFTQADLRTALDRCAAETAGDDAEALGDIRDEMLWLAHANYRLEFPGDCRPSEMVLFPATTYEQRGMEDVRLVRFEHDGGHVTYYGTYTAFDGDATHPMLLETRDFRTFHVSTLRGRYARNKGLALFPRQVDGRYLMVARHDGESLHLLRSRNLYAWNDSELLCEPTETWELVQIGNCGSPVETPEGWLVLTHGVGPVREYAIGALLLDLEDPRRVLGRLREPLMRPTAEEREGYVPNVVYTCGWMIHEGRLVIPYAMSDSRTSFATVRLEALLARLKDEGP